MITRKGQATRDRIVDAAAHQPVGVAGTNPDDIREIAGDSGSQLMHYFSSNQALVRSVILRQSESEASVGHLTLGTLDSFEALRA